MTVEADGATAAGLHETATRPDVLARLAEREGLPGGAATADRISVAPGPTPDRFALTVRAGEPGEAARLANTLGEILAGSGAPCVLADRAAVPSRPVSPGALQVHALGLVIGLMLFVGPPLVRSAVNPVIFSEATLRRLTATPVLVGIPQVRTQNVREASRHRLLVNVLLSISAAAVLAATALVVWT
jgi:hypothetical protein